MDSNVKLIEKYWSDLGGPGSFVSANKLYHTLRLAGYHGISENEIEATLKKLKNYTRFKQKYHRIPPRHVPQRFALISAANLWWYTDSLYIPRGFKGPFRFAILYYDGFSKKLFCRPVVKLNAASSLRVFREIVEQENNSRYPDRIYCDRGREFLSVYSAFLKEKGIRQIFTNSSQQNKSFYAERMVKVLKSYLVKAYHHHHHSEAIRDVREAISHAVHAYNSTPHSTHNLTPNAAHLSDNFYKVHSALEKRRNQFFDKYIADFDKLNAQFQLGSLVRYRLPRYSFTKDSQPHFSQQVYKIVSIVPSEPLKGYKLAELDGTGQNSDIIIPGSFLPDQLMKV